MSDLTQELIAAADTLQQGGKYQEALAKYDEAIALDSNDGYIYALKASIYKKLDKNQEAVENYEKALNLGQNLPWIYLDLGYLLTFKIARREDALNYYNKAVELDPSNLDAILLYRGNCLIALDRTEEAKQDFTTAIRNKTQSAEPYSYLGKFFEAEGKQKEAMKSYNMGLTKNASDLNCGLMKANLLTEMGKANEAIQIYQHLLMLFPSDVVANYRAGCIYSSLGDEREARKRYEIGARANTNSILADCAKGQCLDRLGRHEEALEMYRKVQNSILDPNRLEIILPSFLNGARIALKAVLEAEEIERLAQSEAGKYDSNAPPVQTFIMNIKALQEKKILAQYKVLNQLNSNVCTSDNQDLASLDQVTEAYTKEIATLNEEMTYYQNEVSTQVHFSKNTVDETKDEQPSVIDIEDFQKRLEIEVDNGNLPDDDKKKLKEYFNAFLCTFSCAYASSQAVDTGLVQFDSDSNSSSILSFLALFAPVLAGALDSGIKSLGEFLQSTQVRSAAEAIRCLAPDSAALNQLVSKIAFHLIVNKKKQQRILKITHQELNKLTGNIFPQIFEFCRATNEPINAYLYTELYKAAPERLAHYDANQLIDLWIKGQITSAGKENQFIEQALKLDAGEPRVDKNMGCIDMLEGKGCNMF